MLNFFDLPLELRDSIYKAVVPSKSVLVLPSSTSRRVPCPPILLVSRQIYHECSGILYHESCVAFRPDRAAIAELSRRAARHHASNIILLLEYWIMSQGYHVLHVWNAMIPKILSIFKNLGAIALRLLVHNTPIETKQPHFFPKTLLKKPWSAIIHSLTIDINAQRFFREDTRKPLIDLKKLPNLTELDLRIRTCKSTHSTCRSIGSSEAYISSQAHQQNMSLLETRETGELSHCLLPIVEHFPNVKLFRLWRLIAHANYVRYEPIRQERVLDLFGGRAVSPDRLN